MSPSRRACSSNSVGAGPGTFTGLPLLQPAFPRLCVIVRAERCNAASRAGERVLIDCPGVLTITSSSGLWSDGALPFSRTTQLLKFIETVRALSNMTEDRCGLRICATGCQSFERLSSWAANPLRVRKVPMQDFFECVHQIFFRIHQLGCSVARGFRQIPPSAESHDPGPLSMKIFLHRPEVTDDEYREMEFRRV